MADNADNQEVPSIDQLLNTGENDDRFPTDDDKKDDEGKQDAGTPPADDKGGNQGGDDNDGDNEGNLKQLLSTFGNDEGLEEDQITLRKDLLTKHGGHTFDQHGNIIDENGEVHKSFEDLMKYAMEQEENKLDADGNEVDEDGNIVKTKLELARENTTVNKLHYNSGYDFLDENGDVKIYSDDEDGINEYSRDVSQQRFQEWRESFFNQHPLLAEVSKHILSGGDLSTFHEPIDYTQVDVTQLSEDEKEMYIRRSFEILGTPTNRINGLVQMFKDGDMMDAETITALDQLHQYSYHEAARREQEYQAYEEQRAQEVEEYWHGVEQIVEKGDLGDINIPANERNAFMHYLSSPIDDSGNTRESMDRSKETMEQMLTFAYMRYKGYDLNALVNSKVTLQKAKTLKQRLINSAKLKQTADKGGKSKSHLSADNVTIDNLL